MLFVFAFLMPRLTGIFIALANVFDEMSRDKGIWGFALTEKRFVYKGQRIVGGLLFASVISSTLSLNY